MLNTKITHPVRRISKLIFSRRGGECTRRAHQRTTCTYVQDYSDSQQFFTTWHPVPIWNFDPKVARSHLSSLLPLSGGGCRNTIRAAGGPPGTWHPNFGIMYALHIYSNSCIHITTIEFTNLRANPNSFGRIRNTCNFSAAPPSCTPTYGYISTRSSQRRYFRCVRPPGSGENRL